MTAGFERILKSTGEVWADESRFQRQDGSYAEVEARARVIGDPAGTAVRLVGGFSDVTGVDGQLERGLDGCLKGRIVVPRASAGWPGGGLRVEPVSAEGEVAIEPSSGAHRLTRARLVADETSLEASGRLERLAPLTAHVEVGAAIDARLFRRLQADLEMEGRMDARLSFAHGAGGGVGSLTAETTALSVTGVGPWRGRAQARFAGRRLVLETAELQGYDGRLSASGEILLWEGRTDLDVRAAGIDVAAFAATFAGFRPPISSRADGGLRPLWSTRDHVRDVLGASWRVDRGRCTGRHPPP